MPEEIQKMFFDGTDDDFKRIVDSYQLLLYSVVYATSAKADADDIVQETFIYAYYHWGTLRNKEKLPSWLCAIAKNKASHAIRTSEKTVSLENLADKISVLSPESSLMRREEQMEIRKKLAVLSEKYRETVMLYYFAGKSISEISSLLEVPEGTVKFRLHEGRKQLKKELVCMMDVEKKQTKERNIWENIQDEIHRAREAFHACQKSESNAICDLLIRQFKDINPTMLSKEEIFSMIRVYNQKFNANTKSREKNMLYLEKCIELANISKDNRLISECYVLYANELTNIGKKKEAFEYYEKALILAETERDIQQISLFSYWHGTAHLNKNIPDIKKARACFENAVSHKDKLWKSDCGKCIYTLAYSAFTAINRAKKPNQMIGFHATEPCIIKTENSLYLQEQPGFWGGKYGNFCTADIFTHIAHIRPFLSNDIYEGYSFEKEIFSSSKTPVRSHYEVVAMDVCVQTPAGIFENCLHVRYTDKTDGLCNPKRNGVRDLFYAPNVGLILMHFKAFSNLEYTLKLTKYDVTPLPNSDFCDRYLPLSIGNLWYYDLYGADGTLFDAVDYENRFEVIAKGKNDIMTSQWSPIPLPNAVKQNKNDIMTSIAHSGWICEKQ
ncbi:MAG: sigma-70 family RNA polymerase sigma factor [Ruminococcaceae bacterium]|nr:sigma-70 family RNA polymerase sigma factor [Oscillospiraceae bacterium]